MGRWCVLPREALLSCRRCCQRRQQTDSTRRPRSEELLALIHDKLKSGNYRFQSARRVLIPKQGTSKMRKLGIPVVIDRIVGASMHSVLEGIFDPGFTASNFGFRRGRSQHQAIRHVQRLVKEGRDWAVTIDLKSFFDEIPHGLILKLIRCKVADEQLVTLLARLLKAGVMVNGGRLKRRAKAVRKAHRSPRCSPTSS
jgi:RNA-directed DNA polymerase